MTRHAKGEKTHMIGTIILFCEYVILYFFMKKSALNMMLEIGSNSRSYPRRYILPSHLVRKIFKLKKAKIPKYLYFRLMMSLFFLFFSPITAVISVCSSFNSKVIGVMMFFPLCFILIDTVQFCISSYIFKRE